MKSLPVMLLWCMLTNSEQNPNTPVNPGYNSLSKSVHHPNGKVLVTRERADELLAIAGTTDPWTKRPDGSTIAWAEASALESLMDMYEATGDRRYLDEASMRSNRTLSRRDDKRGVKDGSGKSRPGWSMGLKYVVAAGQLNDAAGRPVITIKSTPSAYNDSTKVEIIPAGTDRFTIKVYNNHYKRYETFTGLSLSKTDDRFIEKIVNDPMSPYGAKSGEYTDKSNLIRVKVTGAAQPAAQLVYLKPVPLAYMGYMGIIYNPMLRFAEAVRKDPKLNDLVPAANYFIRSAEESYADANRLWRNGHNQGEGYYVTCERGESFPADNVGQPINFLGMHTSAQLALYRLTGKKEYLERSEKMSRLLKNRLKYDQQGDLYVWTYWYEPMTTKGWTPEDNLSANVMQYKAAYNIEDTSHGTLDIAMVMAANRAGIVFDDIDVKRFTNTFLKNVILPDHSGLRRKVDGEGDEHLPYFNALHGWLELAEKNPDVYHAIRHAYINKGQENPAFCAALLKWEKKLNIR